MPAHYCSTCGTKIVYETAKPKTCPKCKEDILDPFAIMAQAAASAVPVPVAKPKRAPRPTVIEEEEEDDRPIIEPARGLKSRPIVRKPHRHFAAGAKPQDPDDDDGGDEVFDDDGQPLDRHEAKRRARELAASMGSVTLRMVEDMGATPVRFQDWCTLPPTNPPQA